MKKHHLKSYYVLQRKKECKFEIIVHGVRMRKACIKKGGNTQPFSISPWGGVV